MDTICDKHYIHKVFEFNLDFNVCTRKKKNNKKKKKKREKKPKTFFLFPLYCIVCIHLKNWSISADTILKCFSYFFQKMRYDISCKLSP